MAPEINLLTISSTTPHVGAVGGPTHIDDLAEKEAKIIRNTTAQVPNLPSLTLTEGASLDGRVTPGPLVTENLIRIANEELPAYVEELKQIATQETVPSKFPHLAWEAIQVGLKREAFIHNKLNAHIDAIERSHDDISLLLTLNAELGGVKEDENNELSEKAQNLIAQLKERGIELKGESAGEIKRQASAHESRLRSEIQIKFTTKVQTLMQQVESLMQILQNIIRSDSKLKEKANQLPR